MSCINEQEWFKTKLRSLIELHGNFPFRHKRKGTVHCSAECNGGSVYHWGLLLRAQLVIYSKRSGTGPGCGRVHRSGSLFTFHLTTMLRFLPCPPVVTLKVQYYPERSNRTSLWALSGLLPYITIIVGPSAAALSGAQNSDFPQWKYALNWYCKLQYPNTPCSSWTFVIKNSILKDYWSIMRSGGARCVGGIAIKGKKISQFIEMT